MTRFTAFLLALLPALLLCTVQAQAAELVASVDRSRLNSGETVELTLETSDVTQFGKPDLTPLEPLFEVRGTRQVNQLNTLNGDTQATTRWIITLMPRQNGSVVIPSLQLGDVQSQPITVQVIESETQDSSNTLAPVFIEASLDQNSVYVQAQAILTLRIYHSVSLYDDSSLTPLQIPDARIEQLGDSRTYEKVINGLRHGVIEMRYAIYPQHSGELTIPAQMFSATPVDTRPSQDATPQGPKPGKQMRVKSAEIPLTVKAKPGTYPADVPWLPARSLSLGESWSPEPDHLQVGDSLTRSLTLNAEGLASSQLPPLPATEINGLRRYPDQPVLGNQSSERGLIGSREDREALVPTRTGNIDLPSVEVVWWNTFEDHLEHSSLPARTLQVASNPSLIVDTPTGSPQVMSGANNEALWWKLSTVILACTTLLGFGLWWRARWQPAILRAAQTGPSPRTLLDDLKRACQANDSHAT
ncbi:MAG: BatD family protein, partial [Pseudomonas sp.]